MTALLMPPMPNLPPSPAELAGTPLAALAEWLPTVTGRSTADDLVAILSDQSLSKLTAGHLATFTRPRVEAIGRRLIAKTTEAELLCYTWMPGVAAPIHHHVKGTGAVRAIQGALVESRYELCDGTLSVADTGTLLAGQTMSTPYEMIHRVWTPGPETAISLHLHIPALGMLMVYDPRLAEPEV